MKRSGGSGSVYKLGGNKKRRKPYVARLTTGYTDEGKQQYLYIGTYSTQKEAVAALDSYIKNGSNYDNLSMTFKEVFENWKKEKYPTLSESSKNSYNTSFKKCKDLYNERFIDINKLNNYQKIIDSCRDKGFSTRINIKNLISQLSKYCMKNDIITKDYSKFLNVGRNDKKKDKTPFIKEDIKKLWDNIDNEELEGISTILLLLYGGERINELLNFRIENVHLDNEYPYIIGGSKTRAGKNRIIPIHNKILPIVKKYYELNKNNEYLICNSNGKHISYPTYRDKIWDPIMEKLEMDNRTPHSTRHTTITLLHGVGADPLNIKKIVGHSSNDVTDDIYTHVEIKDLWETINLIDI